MLSAPIQHIGWTKLNSTGDPSVTEFINSVQAQNLPNARILRSFQLNRTLTQQEQLDISVMSNLTS
ncbi:unnamed protein product [Penicillium roqueforti FM164]|uniref:Genomic scaffold, ProqFM164S02 n=1 Tax=Penicillium roqueforti (strain FM164) TaxID=1365484 RepID=W6Q4X6_PENRF|nr:unnamed protein product [Penicillium roqueforti FM164]